MNEANDERIRELLKQSLGAVDVEMSRDLWPRMLQRMDERPGHVPWFDWALLAALVLGLFFVPGVIPVLLYHL
jgi:hypothetical protein